MNHRSGNRLRHRVATAGVALLGVLAVLLGLGQPAQAQDEESATPLAAGLRISNGRLVESDGNDFVMRGVNHAHTWYTSQTSSFANIKRLGANTVRVVLSSGHRWTRNDAADVTNVINLCKTNRLICVLEVHDTTGYGDQAGAVSLDAAVEYWKSVRSALAGQESYVILNIGNEPWGNTNAAGWTADTRAAVQELRAEGFEHTIMVDAPNWGQDWQGIMRANAQSVFNADPRRNTIFSVHMYGVYDTAAEVRDYLTSFADAGLPVLVGEFGHNHSDGNPDEDAIMSITQQLGLGYIGWSWSGNSSDVGYLDMVTNFNPSQLTSWGQRFFNGANGIAQTSREATIFGGGNPGDTQRPTTPGTPTAGSVGSTTVGLSWAASTNNVGVARYEVVRVSGTTETVVATSATPAAAVTGLSPATAYTFAVYAVDAAGNRSTRSGTVSATTQNGDTSPASCGVTYRAVGEWGNGFQGEITIRNTGASAISGWALGFSFPDGQTITNMWGGTPNQSDASVTIAPADYTRTITPSASVTLGFIATKGSANRAPSTFTLNGGQCTVG